MGYDIKLGKQIIGSVGPDNKINYIPEKVTAAISEIIAGQGGRTGGLFTSAKVIYRWDKNRKTNNDMVYSIWQNNPLISNRVNQLNSLIFGRGMKYMYDEGTQEIIDRFWRINRLRSKLTMISTDGQLYGEVFMALYPQKTGDVKIAFYESNQVEIDFNPGNVFEINKYIISFKNEETGKTETINLAPIDEFLNSIEFEAYIPFGRTSRKRGNIGMRGRSLMNRTKGVMAHVKFNCSTSDIYGISDFKQVMDILPDYMDFVGDRLTLHQLFSSPAYDITIDTDDPQVIVDRVAELAGFSIGSNPVHNAKEEWKPLQADMKKTNADNDEDVMRGLISAGLSFPEHLVFNQLRQRNENENTFAIMKIAEDRQDSYGEILADIHKYVVAIAGGDPSSIDNGQIIFPEVNTMSEKQKAETYALLTGANIISRQTASTTLGHNWQVEEPKMIEEMEKFGLVTENPDMAGRLGGRESESRSGQSSNPDDGSSDRRARMGSRNITTQVFGDRKANN
jgi:hypothetical protein